MGKVLLAPNRYAATRGDGGRPRALHAEHDHRLPDALTAELAEVLDRGWAGRRRGARGRRGLARRADRRPPRRHGRRDRHLRARSSGWPRTARRGATSCRSCARRRAPCRATSARSRGECRERGRKSGVSERYIASVDQGTASSRCLVFDQRARVVSVSQVEHRHIFPRPGLRRARPRARSGATSSTSSPTRSPRRSSRSPTSSRSASPTSARRRCCGTRATGEPVHNALNWQDTRTDHLVRELEGEEGPDRFRDRCGLPLATYFSGPKIRWLLDNVDGLRERARGGRRALRDDGLVADLEALRPPPDRRDERRPHDADEPRDARLGRRAARRDGRAARDAARDPALDGGLRRGGRRARRPAGRRRARRPARRAVRPDVLRARRRQVHLRHRQLPADEHGRRSRCARPTAC